jgi:MHS family proline/betaine transporter-like MFS transporter
MLVYFGTFLEFFEFMLFVALFPVLSQIFSSHFSPEQLATLSYLLFWIGFMARPLGALILSPIGDKKSRKRLLVISVVGMSLTTLFMGSIPVGDSPTLTIILIALLRLCQGFFTGIEFSAATIYIFENVNTINSSSPQKYHAILIMGMMTTLGMALAYFVAALCQLEFIAALSFWRAAFILTGFLSLWIGILRLTRLPDDYHKASTLNPIPDPVFSFKDCIPIFFLIGISYGPFYYISTFLNTYSVVLKKEDAFSGLIFNAGICLFYTFIIFIIFKIAKPLFYKKKYISFYHILFIVCLGSLSALIFTTDSLLLSFACQAVLIFISQLIVSHINVNVISFFPPYFRVRGYSLVQTLAASCLGGAAPLICHWLTISYNSRLCAVIYPMGLTFLSFKSYKIMQHKFKEKI